MINAAYLIEIVLTLNRRDFRRSDIEPMSIEPNMSHWAGPLRQYLGNLEVYLFPGSKPNSHPGHEEEIVNPTVPDPTLLRLAPPRPAPVLPDATVH